MWIAERHPYVRRPTLTSLMIDSRNVELDMHSSWSNDCRDV